MDGIKVDEGGSGEQYKHELSPDRQQLKGAGDIDRQSRGCRGEYIGVAGVGGSIPCRVLCPLIRWPPAAPKGTLPASTQMSRCLHWSSSSTRKKLELLRLPWPAVQVDIIGAQLSCR